MQEVREASQQVRVRQLGMLCCKAHLKLDETRYATDMLTILQKLEKKIPGAPENEVPVHERKRQIYAHSITTQ